MPDQHEPWHLSDAEIWGEVDFALVSKWMVSSQRSEENRRKRESQEALMQRDPATRRRIAEAFGRMMQSWASAWARVEMSFEVSLSPLQDWSQGQNRKTEGDAPRAKLGRQSPVRERGPRTAPHFKAALSERRPSHAKDRAVPRQHRSQHR